MYIIIDIFFIGELKRIKLKFNELEKLDKLNN